MYNLESYGGRLFALASAMLWNSLPKSLRDLQSVETFIRKLKEHLFLPAYIERWIFIVVVLFINNIYNFPPVKRFLDHWDKMLYRFIIIIIIIIIIRHDCV